MTSLGNATMPFFASIEFCSCWVRTRPGQRRLCCDWAARKTHLVAEDALDSLDARALVLGKNLLDALGDLPVARSRLDETDRGLGGVVRGGEERGTDVGHGKGGRGDDDAVHDNV